MLQILIATISLISGNIPASISSAGREVHTLTLSGAQDSISRYELIHALQQVIKDLLLANDQNLEEGHVKARFIDALRGLVLKGVFCLFTVAYRPTDSCVLLIWCIMK